MRNKKTGLFATALKGATLYQKKELRNRTLCPALKSPVRVGEKTRSGLRLKGSRSRKEKRIER
jgi:hypothetical protein